MKLTRLILAFALICGACGKGDGGGDKASGSLGIRNNKPLRDARQLVQHDNAALDELHRSFAAAVKAGPAGVSKHAEELKSAKSPDLNADLIGSVLQTHLDPALAKQLATHHAALAAFAKDLKEHQALVDRDRRGRTGTSGPYRYGVIVAGLDEVRPEPPLARLVELGDNVCVGADKPQPDPCKEIRGFRYRMDPAGQWGMGAVSAKANDRGTLLPVLATPVWDAVAGRNDLSVGQALYLARIADLEHRSGQLFEQGKALDMRIAALVGDK